MLKSGACSVMIDGKNVGKIIPGSSFGEVALTIPGQVRTASIVASEACGAWRLDAEAYKKEIESKAEAAKIEAEEAQSSPRVGGWRERRAQRRSHHAEQQSEPMSRRRSGSEEREPTSFAQDSDDGDDWGSRRVSGQDESGDEYHDDRRSDRRDPPRRMSRRGRPRSRSRSRSFSGDESELSLSSDDSGTDIDGRGPSRLERKLLHALHEERQLRRALEKRVEKLERQVATSFPDQETAPRRRDDENSSTSGRKKTAGRSRGRDNERDSSKSGHRRSSRR